MVLIIMKDARELEHSQLRKIESAHRAQVPKDIQIAFPQWLIRYLLINLFFLDTCVLIFNYALIKLGQVIYIPSWESWAL